MFTLDTKVLFPKNKGIFGYCHAKGDDEA